MKKTILTIAAAAIATSAFGVPDLSIANKIGYAYPGTATIDGVIGAGEWDAAVDDPQAINSFIQAGDNSFTPPSSEADLSGQWWAMWDANALYILIAAQDETFPLEADAFEIYASTAYTRQFGQWAAPGYDQLSDIQAVFAFDGSGGLTGTEGLYSANSNTALPSSVEYVHTVTEVGYTVEIRIPWSFLLQNGETTGVSFDPEVGMFYDGPDTAGVGAERNFIGFDVHLQDNDDAAPRDTKLAWCPGFEGRIGDNHWADTQVWGTLVLETGTTPPPCTVTDVVFANAPYADLGGDFVYNWVTEDFLYTEFCPFVFSFNAGNWWFIAEANASAAGFFAYDFASTSWKWVQEGIAYDL